jgi:Domain of unknown function (DUF4279)
MARHWVSSAVRVTSATARIDEISAALGMEPTRAHERGTLTSPRNPNSKRRDRLVWIVESDVPDEASLEDHLRWAAELGETIRERAAALPEDWSGDIHIGWRPKESQEAVFLDRGLVAALAATSLNVLLTAYRIEPGER